MELHYLLLLSVWNIGTKHGVITTPPIHDVYTEAKSHYPPGKHHANNF